jgi:hypothetical protein
VGVLTDPAETGGLFVGRRPGTAPTHFRAPPKLGSPTRQRIDGYLADLIVVAIAALSLLCWGPIPLACLWIGSLVDYLSGSVFLGIVVALLSLFPLLFGTLMLLRRVDGAWILVRRAAGHDQRTGVMTRIFATTAFVCATVFAIWFVVIHGPGSSITPGGGETPPWPG